MPRQPCCQPSKHRGPADPGQSRPGSVRPRKVLRDPAPKPGSMRRILQNPAGSCAQARVNTTLALQDPARSGALADP
eukprot:596194-Pyramimonas_sp.AAC.1